MPGVTMEGIRKLFPSSGALANDSASLRVEDREIHALVGENGAGKSTLMRVLCGLERPDSGRVEVGGRALRLGRPGAAAALGIGMVQQHFTTIPGFSVAENAVLGSEPRRAAFFLDRRRAEAEVSRLAEAHGFSLPAAAPASSLSVGERQQLEIVKLLYRRADILVLDEPTAVLAEQEIASLFATLRALREAGKTVILITHKVREVLEIADSVTVMRRGRSVARLASAELDEAGLACLMMGSSCEPERGEGGPGPRRRREPGPEVFALREASLLPRGGGRPLLDRVSLSVRSGEILGVCGVVGNGLGALEDLASGLARPSSGEALLEGRPLAGGRGPRLGYVPADRMRRGACLDATLLENLVALDRGSLFPRGILDRAGAAAFARAAIERFSIAARPEQPMSSLSGGNVQKAVLARELAGDSAFILFSNPSWGLDLAATSFVHERIRSAAERGAGILLVSANLDEVLLLADRVCAMYRGRIVCELENGGASGEVLDRALLGEYMLGLREDRGTAAGEGRAHGGA
ncbi:MAG TPA: ATP-binding cassette domain-containing protein [Spirochaetales bacterium]|nr:ATP-binding cassette domain-containing protein [Spirochaetales bacterium]HRY55594.1 ATP-binding cassette domain-containing protein [Spirochaetia bacterium]HRZ63864.1 ATP-binding cassette domain-containing protein [Spirochaetia bacterium]